MSDEAAEKFKDLTGANDDTSDGGSEADGGADGDGGGGFLGVINPFTEAAASGDLQLGDEPGHFLLKAIEIGRTELEPVMFDSRFLQQQRKLGCSGQAEVLKKYLPTVADDHPEAMLPRIREFLSKLDQFEAAVHKGMENYRANEEDNVGFFKRGVL